MMCPVPTTFRRPTNAQASLRIPNHMAVLCEKLSKEDLTPRIPKSLETWTDNFSPFIFDLSNTGLVKIYVKIVWQNSVLSIQWF